MSEGPLQGDPNGSGRSTEPPAASVSGRGDVSVVIVTRERPADLAKCLASLELASEGDIAEVIIVDDASELPPSLGRSTLKTTVVRNEKRSYLSQSRNRGARESVGRYIMFVDDDNVLERSSIAALSAALDGHAQTMVASPVICYTSQPKTVWFAGARIAPVSGIFEAAYRGRDSDSLPAAPYRTEVFHDAFMVRREAFERVGYFDEVNFPMYLSEADLAARLRESGFDALVVPASRVWHSIAPLEGASSLLRGVHITEPVRAYFVGRNRLFYMRRHGDPVSFLVHVAVFQPVFMLIHVFAILSGRSRTPRTQLLGSYMRGVFDGLAGKVRMGRDLLRSFG